MRLMLLCMISLLSSIACAKGLNDCIEDRLKDGIDCKQWFIQDSAYTSLENALKRVNSIKERYEKKYLTEAEWSHGIVYEPNAHVSVYVQNGMYKVIIGPYVSQKKAKQSASPDHGIPFIFMLKKYSYDDFEYGYRFTLKRITPDAYENILVKHIREREGTADASQFIKTSVDGSLRFIQLSDGKRYIAQMDGSKQKTLHALDPLLQEHGIEHIDLDNMVWTDDHRFLFYGTIQFGSPPYPVVYTYEVYLSDGSNDTEGLVLQSIDSNRMEIRNTKRQQTLAREKIDVIEDFAIAKKMLKEKGLKLDEGTNPGWIEDMQCGDSKKVDLSWVLGFVAYFPQEQVLYTSGEGFSEIAFSTENCERTTKNPYTIHHANDHQWRLSALGVSEMDATHYVIERWDEQKKQYIPLRDIDAFFTDVPDIPLDKVVWVNALQEGNEKVVLPSLYFPVILEDNTSYYAVEIEPLPVK